ncbi:DUF2589 domain-containing protein [Myroides odoratus]|uniref:DUF2589 domain-containing protein n=1 Tax=Myroides odoratus TaxID=256 RepID=A0A9Q6Z4J8_MYROD|nr:DUF2589 domain-containing protein [Myroides odoratus]EHQ44420.1 hypothetical protein Myrod_3623 [Myroides odoratus DSM 2801]EKB03801.1 hypothetical protein HMPREF9716_03433 [Myroides odoratus CIP 103059]QQU01689.1 DUF2589 domain-containing protein [Myroides odoratus]WQD56029.1 DUF2589 domain-containing protein [Myroides odoratus]STZ31759.1 Protein of uncharacterised function (DUF2589) [Myroides odoratus]
MSANLVSIAQQFTGIPMDALIGGPLNAAADANAKMAISQTKFILDTCFVRKGEENEVSYQPILIKMELERAFVLEDETIEKITTTFHLPLLTIMPINSLGVDSVDVNFDMEVNSSYSEETSKEKNVNKAAEANLEAKIGFGVFSATIKGKVSYDSKASHKESQHYSKSNAAKYSLKVHAGQLPLPIGVTTIIDVFSKSIDPVTSTKNAE